MIEQGAPDMKPSTDVAPSRRVVLQAGAWSIPAIAVMSASPAFATSGGNLPAGLVVNYGVARHTPTTTEAEALGLDPSEVGANGVYGTSIHGFSVSYHPVQRDAAPLDVVIQITIPQGWFHAPDRESVWGRWYYRKSWGGPVIRPVPRAGVPDDTDAWENGYAAVNFGSDLEVLSLMVTLAPGESTDPEGRLDFRIAPDRGQQLSIVTNAAGAAAPHVLPVRTATELAGQPLGRDPRYVIEPDLGVLHLEVDEIEDVVAMVRAYMAHQGMTGEALDEFMTDVRADLVEMANEPREGGLPVYLTVVQQSPAEMESRRYHVTYEFTLPDAWAEADITYTWVHPGGNSSDSWDYALLVAPFADETPVPRPVAAGSPRFEAPFLAALYGTSDSSSLRLLAQLEILEPVPAGGVIGYQVTVQEEGGAAPEVFTGTMTVRSYSQMYREMLDELMASSGAEGADARSPHVTTSPLLSAQGKLLAPGKLLRSR